MLTLQIWNRKVAFALSRRRRPNGRGRRWDRLRRSRAGCFRLVGAKHEIGELRILLNLAVKVLEHHFVAPRVGVNVVPADSQFDQDLRPGISIEQINYRYS